MKYPTKQELDRMGATLERDVVLWTPALAAWCGRPSTATVRVQAETKPKRVVAWPRKRTGKRIA